MTKKSESVQIPKALVYYLTPKVLQQWGFNGLEAKTFRGEVYVELWLGPDPDTGAELLMNLFYNHCKEEAERVLGFEIEDTGMRAWAGDGPGALRQMLGSVTSPRKN